MGEPGSLGPFAAEDFFLRHVDRKRRLKNGIVLWEVFDDRHPTLSLTYQDANLRTDGALDRYQQDKKLQYGDLPGLCRLSFRDLTESLEPALPPRHDPDPEDEQYGHLHCCTDRPISQAQMEIMATLAPKNGIVREFVRKRKRGLR